MTEADLSTYRNSDCRVSMAIEKRKELPNLAGKGKNDKLNAVIKTGAGARLRKPM